VPEPGRLLEPRLEEADGLLAQGPPDGAHDLPGDLAGRLLGARQQARAAPQPRGQVLPEPAVLLQAVGGLHGRQAEDGGRLGDLLAQGLGEAADLAQGHRQLLRSGGHGAEACRSRARGAGGGRAGREVRCLTTATGRSAATATAAATEATAAAIDTIHPGVPATSAVCTAWAAAGAACARKERSLFSVGLGRGRPQRRIRVLSAGETGESGAIVPLLELEGGACVVVARVRRGRAGEAPPPRGGEVGSDDMPGPEGFQAPAVKMTGRR